MSERSAGGAFIGAQALSPTVGIAATQPEYGPVAIRQARRCLRIHCVDPAEELPLIGRELDQFAVATVVAAPTVARATQRLANSGPIAICGGSAGAPTTSKQRLLDKMASDRLGLKLYD